MPRFKLLAGRCANCNAGLWEGTEAVRDNNTDNLFCDEQCFDEWFVEKYAGIYRKQYVEEADL